MTDKKDFPEITLDDANKFWKLFSEKHPDINRQLINKTFVNGDIGAFKPKSLDDNSYRIFERFLKRWMANNGFWHKQIDEIYVSLNDDKNKGVRAIDTSTIIDIKGIDDKISSISIKENDMEQPITIYVKEFVEDLRKNVYIF